MKKYFVGVGSLVSVLLVILVLSFIPFKTLNTDKKPIRVITGLNFYGEVAQQVAGKYGKVTSLIDNASVDPHDYQPGTAQAKQVGDANVVIENGLGYDEWLNKITNSDAQHHTQKVVNVGRLMGKQTGDNEHLWYEPTTMKKLAQDLAVQYGKLDPAHQSYYRKNSQKYINSLKPLEQETARIKANIDPANNKVAVSEPVFDYSLSALGYQVMDQHFEKAIEDDNDPSPQDIQQLQAVIKNHEIAFFVENSQTNAQVVNGLVKLARENHVPVLKVTETKPNSAKSYQEWMLSQYRALSRIQQGEK
ncbi:metal ABC transporter solute-binding protein, Zn/Mn family [Limosilactobacillus fastidiosus]|uniref:Zinc ABC transporter substrate-binding protein n=1 Tax=Limosilactobacillus fastidiosus TaxID=2759855 RepID=A0A7W3U084_9LACO|nr:zinc ABC transporter substrate-binding protein [Limosilactobacillus fastidiosus]MBB1086494.1 zinc ABC transporter substrate-binding protein [Limosilactobacillus fastidiosus]MCD7085154.1 zinc ABC transporter substrate-binding protein [Limosilactobacillus fastidiosus]MCD7115082.1 zinc ABC transporter substrate-binding protein [Limosilactobacillus fastidiosus]MCD7116234.1 zinc ABC transporter substrate-binding protein [Limosilactobacillus fastidiosus]